MKTTNIGQLMHLLADTGQPLAVSQLYHLSDLAGERLAQFRQTWAKIPVERRRQILGFLIEITESNLEVDFTTAFGACLNDDDGEVRALCVEGLWESESPELFERLLDMAQHDPFETARAAAVTALGRFVLLAELGHLSAQSRQAAEETLLALYHSASQGIEVRRRAVEALAASERPELPGIIESAYYDPDRRMRVSSIFAMGRSLDPQWEPLLLDELRSHDAECRYEAARACGEIALESAIPRLALLLQEEDREVQEASIWALGQIGGQQARQILEEFLDSLDLLEETLREAVEDALSDLALAAGVMQFPLYDYPVDSELPTASWGEDWISGVLGNDDISYPDETDDQEEP
ncbi:MAG: HEAT repeat domain-containing protein [Chloroflexota bacterium]